LKWVRFGMEDSVMTERTRHMNQVMWALVMGLFCLGSVAVAGGIIKPGLIQDLDAELGVTVAGAEVTAWDNQASSGGDDVSTNRGAPQLVPGPLGRSAVYLSDGARLAGTNVNAFTSIMQGSGHTWFVVVKPDLQSGNQTKNAVFGTLMGSGPWSGIVGHVSGTDAPLVVNYMVRASSDVFVTGTTDLYDEEWHIIGGRLAEGTGSVLAEVFVDMPVAEASASAAIPGACAELTIGAERSGGNEAYDGALARLLIYNRPLSDAELKQTMSALYAKYFVPTLASGSVPADQEQDVPRDVVLNWTPGIYAATHNVYFGLTFDDVNVADLDSPMGMLVSQGQAENSLDVGALEYGQSYHWRVDEVNAAPDHAVFKGEVWRFTVEPYAIPVESILATASSSHQENMGPEKTVDGSGLDATDQHSTESTEMWLSGMGDPTPSIQYEFDKPYKLHEILVWNSNQLIEAFVGIGAKDVTLEYSTDGVDWQILEGVGQFAQASGTPAYTANTRVDFGGVLVKYVKITVNTGYGMLPQYGLSEVRFLYIPTFAREPQPIHAGTSEGTDLVLNWRAGREAASHQVYFGTSADALALEGTTEEATLTVEALNYNSSYYWSVTEVNEAEAVSAYAGDVWRFNTPAYGVVDDFEGYDDACKRLFFAWEDGLGHNGGEDVEDCDEPASNGNGGGSIVGNASAPFAEKTIVNAGAQSMPFEYDNSFGVSEATLSLNGEDWTASGIKTLSLAFHGTAGNTGQLYVKINNTKVLYDLDATDIAAEQWQTWNIDLSSVGGNVTNVTSMAIGVDGAAASGMLYIDDIRLYP
jgi:hypothetical protein